MSSVQEVYEAIQASGNTTFETADFALHAKQSAAAFSI
jgi:hypothetical protein